MSGRVMRVVRGGVVGVPSSAYKREFNTGISGVGGLTGTPPGLFQGMWRCAGGDVSSSDTRGGGYPPLAGDGGGSRGENKVLEGERLYGSLCWGVVLTGGSLKT
eukprot:753131-Hanusia_phi.AAC.1